MKKFNITIYWPYDAYTGEKPISIVLLEGITQIEFSENVTSFKDSKGIQIYIKDVPYSIWEVASGELWEGKEA